MPVRMDHLTVQARDKKAAMEWMAGILGVEPGPIAEPFAIVELGSFSIDYIHAEPEDVRMQHIALRVDEEEFDAIYARVEEAGVDIYGHPQKPENPGKGQIYYHDGGRGFYFSDLDGHAMEIKTVRDNLDRPDDHVTAPFRPSPPDLRQVRGLTAADARDWMELADGRLLRGDVLNEDDGAEMSVGYMRAREEVTFDFNSELVPYDEAIVVTKGACSVETADQTLMAGPGETLYLPRRSRGVLRAEAGSEMVYVTYPNWKPALGL